jgi:hypothetical protein
MKNEKKRIRFIEKFLKEMRLTFSDMKFRCEFISFSHTYMIEAKPVERFEHDERYAIEEYNFMRRFEDKFLGYTIFFISDNSLMEIENPILTVGYDQQKSDPATQIASRVKAPSKGRLASFASRLGL